MEVSDGGLIHDTISFDPDDVDAAFEELDARYLAGEAAAHAHTWSVISGSYAGFTGTNTSRRRRTGSTSTDDGFQ